MLKSSAQLLVEVSSDFLNCSGCRLQASTIIGDTCKIPILDSGYVESFLSTFNENCFSFFFKYQYSKDVNHMSFKKTLGKFCGVSRPCNLVMLRGLKTVSGEPRQVTSVMDQAS